MPTWTRHGPTCARCSTWMTRSAATPFAAWLPHISSACVGSVRPRLVRTAAGPAGACPSRESAEHAAWLSFDSGRQDAAHRLFTEALAAAQLADDDALSVQVLAGMSLQA